MRRLCFLLAASVFPAATQSGRLVDTNAHAWFMYFGDHPVSGNWGVHLEGQWRRHNVVTSPQQLLLRPAVNYRLNGSAMLTAGYAYVKTHRYGEFPAALAFPEHRAFQQLLLRHNAGPVAIQHRYRVEQRFLGQMVPGADGRPRVDSWRYQNRFRYLAKATVPLRSSPWFLAFYDEILLHFAPNFGPTAFDHNRAYAAVGHRLSKTTHVEIGYMNQLLAQRNGRVMENNHTLQFSIFSTAPFGRGR